MFCPNCGVQIPDGSAFCGTCGAPLGAAGSGTERVLTQDPSLPEGIFRDDSGAYHWVYYDLQIDLFDFFTKDGKQ